jgi:cyclopropane fatty-acyl-phospholipid synthase-like methyltransferase
MKAPALAAALALVLALPAQAQVPLTGPQPQGGARGPDVMYVPTPQATVDAMLKLAGVKKGDVVYDLGSGDGRIPVTAAKAYGVKAVGIDIDPERIAEANANAKAAGVEKLVAFRQADLFESDITEASVVTLYLLSSLNDKLRPKLLKELKPGTRVVSHAFPMTDWEPEKTVQTGGGVIYLWRVP